MVTFKNAYFKRCHLYSTLLFAYQYYSRKLTVSTFFGNICWEKLDRNENISNYLQTKWHFHASYLDEYSSISNVIFVRNLRNLSFISQSVLHMAAVFVYIKLPQIFRIEVTETRFDFSIFFSRNSIRWRINKLVTINNNIITDGLCYKNILSSSFLKWIHFPISKCT